MATPLTAEQSQVRDTVDRAVKSTELLEKKKKKCQDYCSSSLSHILTDVEAVDSRETLTGVGAGGSTKKVQLPSDNTFQD